MSMAKDNKEALMGKEHELGTADRDFFWGCNGRLTQPRRGMACRRAARPVVTTAEAVRATPPLEPQRARRRRQPEMADYYS